MDDYLKIDQESFEALSTDKKLDIVFANIVDLQKTASTEARKTAIVTTSVYMLPIVIAVISILRFC
jgi:hypothetical protein